MHRLVAILGVASALALLGGGDSAVAQRTCFALESQLMQLQARGVARSQAGRAQMLRERMARAGCAYGGQGARSANVRSEPRRQRGMSRQTAPRAHGLRRPEAPAPPSGGTYRTMCVRSCDGYYFPVSFSTTRDRFAADAAICARMCPDREVGLYYHSAAETPAQMTSLDGAAYAELPAAFRYRERFDPGCGCGRPAADPPLAESRSERPAQADGAATRRPAALPRPRLAPAEDPETVANRQGGFIVGEIEPGAFGSAGGRFGRPVRQVGPRYGGDLASELLVRPVSR